MEQHRDHSVPSDRLPFQVSQQIPNGRVESRGNVERLQMPRDGTRNTRVNGITDNHPEDPPPNHLSNHGQPLPSTSSISQGTEGVTISPSSSETVTINGHSSTLGPSTATPSHGVPADVFSGALVNPTDFMQSLDEFVDQSLFRQDGDLNFERDFGQWFNPDDVRLDLTR